MGETTNQIIRVIDENGIERDAEVLTVFEVTATGKNYCIYSIKNDNSDEVSVLASLIEKDEEGYDVLKDIENPEEKKAIYDIVSEIVSNAAEPSMN